MRKAEFDETILICNKIDSVLFVYTSDVVFVRSATNYCFDICRRRHLNASGVIRLRGGIVDGDSGL